MNDKKGPIKAPVYSLKKGDKFVADDGRVWTVDAVHQPEGWNCLPQIGEKPKSHTIFCYIGQWKTQFHYLGSKLVERR